MARFGGVPVLIALACASPTMAHGRGDVPVLQDSLRFEVVGRVAVDCSLSQSQTNVAVENAVDPLTNVVRAAQASLPFSVSCNTPVSVSLDSRNGGLRYQGAPTSDRAFTQLISYGARVALPGHANVLNCRSRDMATRNTICRACLRQHDFGRRLDRCDARARGADAPGHL